MVGSGIDGVRHFFECLFGSLQKITAGQLGLSPTLMAAANSSGGVMGKMIDAQSIVSRGQHRHALVWTRRRHPALRFLSQHKCWRHLVGSYLLVLLQAYVFTVMIVALVL